MGQLAPKASSEHSGGSAGWISALLTCRMKVFIVRLHFVYILLNNFAESMILHMLLRFTCALLSEKVMWRVAVYSRVRIYLTVFHLLVALITALFLVSSLAEISESVFSIHSFLIRLSFFTCSFFHSASHYFIQQNLNEGISWMWGQIELL